jgi:peroxiredoxin
MIKKVRILYILTTLFMALALLSAGCSFEQRPGGKAKIGMPAPLFSLPDLEGGSWNLADLKGKVVFVNFWASWCAPCLEEMPSMVALNKSMPEDYFQMITVLYNDRPEYARSVVKKAGATFPVLLDPDSEAAALYGLTGVPETYIIDPQGILREKIIGPRDWQSLDSMVMIESYFPPDYKKIVR